MKCFVCGHSKSGLSPSASWETSLNLGGQQLLTSKRVSASKAQVE